MTVLSAFAVAGVSAVVFAYATGDDPSTETTAAPGSGVVVAPETAEVQPATSLGEGPRILSDMLPNAKWQWEGGPDAYSDVVVVGTVTDVREGATQPAGPEPVEPESPTLLVDVQVERTIGNGDQGWDGASITIELYPGVPVGGSLSDMVALYEEVEHSVWLVELDGDPVNDGVDGRAFYDAAVAPSGALLALNGKQLPPRVTRGIDTLDKLEHQARKPDYAVDPAERRKDPDYYDYGH